MKEYSTPAFNDKARPFAINGVRFECKPVVKADALSGMFLALVGDEKGRINYDDALKGFFEAVMESDWFTAFEAFILDVDNIVHTKLLYQIAQDLFGEYSGVPFVERFASLASQSNDSESSTDDSSSKEQTSSP